MIQSVCAYTVDLPQRLLCFTVPVGAGAVLFYIFIIIKYAEINKGIISEIIAAIESFHPNPFSGIVNDDIAGIIANNDRIPPTTYETICLFIK